MTSQNKEVVQRKPDRSFTSIQMVHAHTQHNTTPHHTTPKPLCGRESRPQVFPIGGTRVAPRVQCPFCFAICAAVFLPSFYFWQTTSFLALRTWTVEEQIVSFWIVIGSGVFHWASLAHQFRRCAVDKRLTSSLFLFVIVQQIYIRAHR